MMKKSEGFSLIELLVVVAIIGVLASVGIVGYSQYIENTKADVAKTNAQGVERWLTSTQLARTGGLTVDPAVCSTTDNATGGLEHCFQQLTNPSLGTGAAERAAPFASFSNPYQTAAGSPIILYRDDGGNAFDNGSGGATDPGNACDNTTGNRFTALDNGTAISGSLADYRGVIVIQNLDANNEDNMSDSRNRIRVGYCNIDQNFVEVADNISF